jgi:ABC-type cobalamin transport system permease subunit
MVFLVANHLNSHKIDYKNLNYYMIGFVMGVNSHTVELMVVNSHIVELMGANSHIVELMAANSYIVDLMGVNSHASNKCRFSGIAALAANRFKLSRPPGHSACNPNRQTPDQRQA